jgi:hypothetical protein
MLLLLLFTHIINRHISRQIWHHFHQFGKKFILLWLLLSHHLSLLLLLHRVTKHWVIHLIGARHSKGHTHLVGIGVKVGVKVGIWVGALIEARIGAKIGSHILGWRHIHWIRKSRSWLCGLIEHTQNFDDVIIDIISNFNEGNGVFFEVFQCHKLFRLEP